MPGNSLIGSGSIIVVSVIKKRYLDEQSFYCTIFLLVMVYAYEAKQAVQGWREASDPDSQASTMPLQGFLDSIAYGWFRRNFREVALGERVALLAYVHSRAFYDESLTT
ncbi:UNVERIFIED_CONTAM: hypothetical protein FKN15_035260 [Acipenser sinensis]